MPIIEDEEFGKITIRRSPRASQVRLRVAPDGTLRASIPMYAPLFLVKRLVRNSRDELRALLAQSIPKAHYEEGMTIGKSHSLLVKPTSLRTPKATLNGNHITVQLPAGKTLGDSSVIKVVREAVISALRQEAKSYLPKRLAFLAKQSGLHYERVRFSHASGRWGSCSSSGTISLNIALMKLPFELIDYVICHELAHTKHMNHSDEFWKLVATLNPSYKVHRRALKNETPTI